MKTQKIISDARRFGAAQASNLGSHESLPEAVAASQRGDPGAQHRLYEFCHQGVYRLARRMVGSDHAPDVTQQVFLQVFRFIQKFDGRSRFETWLYRLAVNECLQHLRRQRRWQFCQLDWEPMGETGRDDDAERRDLLEQALAQTAPDLRAIFLLKEIEGLSYEEIAVTLEIPIGTVGSRLNRARREIRQRLSDLGFEL